MKNKPLIEIVKVKEEHCLWMEDWEGIWKTDCGDQFCFEDGGPLKNGLKYCGFCGKPLKEESFKEEE